MKAYHILAIAVSAGILVWTVFVMTIGVIIQVQQEPASSRFEVLSEHRMSSGKVLVIRDAVTSQCTAFYDDYKNGAVLGVVPCE